MRVEKKIIYVKLYGLFISLDKNLIILLWLLLNKTNPFNLHVAASKRYFQLFPSCLLKFLRVLNIIRKLMLIKKFIGVKNYPTISVDLDGHILLKTSGGLKVFDLKNEIVASQYTSVYKKEAFISLVRRLEAIQKYNISPKIIEVDFPNKCIYEEFVNFYKAERFELGSNYLMDKILPVWEEITRNTPFTTIYLIEYITNQRDYILNKINDLERQGFDICQLRTISTFVDNIYHNLIEKNKKTYIYLTLTHGDLHAWNILIYSNNSKVIDWDTVKERSLLHDFYYLLIHKMLGRGIDKKFLIELNKLESIILLKIKNLFNESNLDLNLYRKLFYLESIYLDIENRIDVITNKYRIEEGILRMNESIKTFTKIEKN
ncbi:phosphotransferase [Lederbergia wuyishanensis]|uniref:Aminoglycoside phosphotransferase domain-containing protein n=1 Tax=Lederbergia wuyishanensis TaxID=1347903 RepID=A0ABU0D7Y0_9BACI|nr:phosphotransferase [Lederbergia wuyishanensis]MCJ8009135.1 aminoglycoside phosphotransferase family protein [Lederbergia wuyishanensis]MDQ0344475.1 hypothetical protein [Lederbergia wuyishanensis]